MVSLLPSVLPKQKQHAASSLYRFGEQLIAHRVIVMLLTALCTAYFAYHAFQLEMRTAFTDLLPYRHPFIEVHKKFAAQFGGANNITIMLKVETGDVFSIEVLRKIHEMTQALDRMGGVNHDQIASIAHRTTRYLTVSHGIISSPPVMRYLPQTEEEVAEIRQIAYSAEQVYGQLVSLDGRALLIKANFVDGPLDYKKIFYDINRTVKAPFETPTHTIWIAGEPYLYGWIYYYATEAYGIFCAATLCCWVLLYLYFHDWRGALRPTITGVISALWGLGMQALMGFTLDPLTLVIPFFITARAVSHSVQMHDRYYEEYQKAHWDKDRAIISAFAALFVPTLSGIVTDALGMLAMVVVPVVILQHLAISASIWVASVAVSELLLNPVVYHYLNPPSQAVVLGREEGIFQRCMNAGASWIVVPRHAVMIVVFWGIIFLTAVTQLENITVGDSTAVTPLLYEDAPYNRSHVEMQKYFGGVEPLMIVLEGREKEVLKDPVILRTLEQFQRDMERDPNVAYSFSLADVVNTIQMTFYDQQPRWGVIPAQTAKISALYFYYFAGAPPGEISRFLDGGYTTSQVIFYCKNHQGEAVARVIRRAREFVATHPLANADFRLAGGLIGVTAAANEELMKNDLLMNVLGFGTIFLIVMFTYRSVIASLVMMAGLFLANTVVHAYMGYRHLGINLQSLPIVTVGVGFGIDYVLYIVSRAVEEFRGDMTEAVRIGLATAGKGVTFTAITLILATLLWTSSHIRFSADMGVLLALWMGVSFLGSVTFVPAALVLWKPKFFVRALEERIFG